MVIEMDTPIACSLAPGAARSQLDEWQELMVWAVAHAERVSPTRLELHLKPNCDLAAVVDLAQREVACCPFFAFAIDVEADGLVLVVDVPDTASEILDKLISA